MAENIGPLEERDLETIDSLERTLDGLDEVITRCEQAGIPMQEIKQRKDEQKSKLRRFRQSFFPGR